MSANSFAQADLATQADDALIAAALRVMEQRARYNETAFTGPDDCKAYMQLRIGDREHEVFVVAFLDCQMRLLACEEMFRGTLTQTSVYPREVVKRALQLNAGSVVFAHNHPSGTAEPSRADEYLTQTLKSALALIDVRVLDHLVVAAGSVMSFAERGLI